MEGTGNISPEDFKKMSDLEIKESIEYSMLLRQSRLLFPEVDDWVLEIAVLAYFKNGCKDAFEKIDENAVKELKQKYESEPIVYNSVEVVENPVINEEVLLPVETE